MAKGDRLAGEAIAGRDAGTGVVVWQMTRQPSIHHHLYFLTSSMTPGGDDLIVTSYRTGRPELYMAGFPAGDIVQLTEAAGINGYSPTLDRPGRTLYFTRDGATGGEVRALDLGTLDERVLAVFADGRLGELSLGADGRRLVAAMKRAGRSWLTVTETDGSGGRVIHESPQTVIHPQFHPSDPTLIAYSGDPAPRMWMIRADGTGNTCLHAHDNDEFLVHETFLGTGDDLIVVRWPHALQRFVRATRTMTTIAAFTAWHIASSRDGRLVLCDTAHPDTGIQLVAVATGRRKTLCHPGASNGGTQWTRGCYAVAADWETSAARDRAEHLSWMEMPLDTVYGPQWTHPHPSFAAGETRVVFTSDRTGTAQVYVAEIPPGWLEGLE